MKFYECSKNIFIKKKPHPQLCIYIVTIVWFKKIIYAIFLENKRPTYTHTTAFYDFSILFYENALEY